MIINWLKTLFFPRTFGVARSPQWREVKNQYLEKNPLCAVCGSKKVDIHHILPFHLYPTEELKEDNLITLCDGLGTGNHHLWFGHLGSWRSWNDSVVFDSLYFGKKIKNRP